MPSTVVVGGFFGDEGKGKIISYMANKDSPSIIARGGAGPNAGHTIVDGQRTCKVRMLPCGFVNRSARLGIGPGVVVDPEVILREIDEFDVAQQVIVDRRCGVIDASHRDADSHGDLKERIGSTGSGTGPANAARAMRVLRLAQDEPSLAGLVGDVPGALNAALDADEGVLVEGTQGTFLSLWHGTYPYATSKDVTASGICADVGLGPGRVDDVMVVFKAYVTRVGGGPLDGELSAEEAASRGWSEFGAVTGRPRRAAEFDFELAARAVMLNAATQLAVTKLDVAFPGCAGVTEYARLGGDARAFIEEIESRLGVRVALIGTGPRARDIVDRRHEHM